MPRGPCGVSTSLVVDVVLVVVELACTGAVLDVDWLASIVVVEPLARSVVDVPLPPPVNPIQSATIAAATMRTTASR